MEKEKKNRVEYLDVARGIAMLCIILAHMPVQDISWFVSRVCFSFHVPLFFLVSGYFYKKTEIKKLIEIKSKKFVFPYILTCIAVIVSSIWFNRILHNNAISVERNVLEWIWASFYGSGNSYMNPYWIKEIGAIWFLLCILLSIIILEFCMQKKHPIAWIAVIVWMGWYTTPVIWLPFSIQAAFVAVGYLYIGYKVKEYNILERLINSPIIVATSFALWLFYLMCDGGQIYIVRSYFKYGIICEMFFSTVAAFCVTWFSYVICNLKSNFLKNILTFYGRNSLLVLCAHLVELNTFPWDRLLNRLVQMNISHSYRVFIWFALKVLWVTIAIWAISKVKILLYKGKKIENTYKNLMAISERKLSIENVVKGLAILLIVLGHLQLDQQVRIIIFSFHIPLLFVLAGYSYRDGSLKEVIYGYGRSLLIGYFAVRLCYILIAVWKDRFYFGGSIPTHHLLLRTWLRGTFAGMSFSSHILTDVESVGPVWIIPCLFFSIILFCLILKLKKEILRLCAVMLITACGIYLGKYVAYLPYSFDVAMAATGFLYIGYCVRQYDLIRRISGWKMVFFGFIMWIVGIRIGGIELAIRNYPFIFVSIISAAAGSWIVILCCRELMNLSGVCQILDFFGRNFIFFLGVHSLELQFCNWDSIFQSVPIWVQFMIKLMLYISLYIMWDILRAYYSQIAKFCTGILEKYDVDRLGQVLENAYLFVFGIHLLRLFFDTALFYIPWTKYFNIMFRCSAIIIICLKAVCIKEYKVLSWKLGIGTVCFFALSWASTGYVFLLDVAILLLGALQIPYKKILKVYFWCGLVVLSLAILGALTGCIDDLLYFDSERYKHAFGIVYTTDFAAHVVYLTLAFWIIYETIPAGITFAVTILLSAIIYHYCGAKCSTIVLLLTGIGILYVSAAKWLENKNAFGQKVIKWLDYILMIFMSLCAAVMIGLTMCYNPDNAILAKIDVLLSGRLRLAKEAIDLYGIKLFGTAFDMIGRGGNNVRRLAYNFVDSSYCMILVRYGPILLLCVLFLYIWTAKKAIKSKRRNLLVALAVIAIHNMIEHHLLELAYNAFILLAFADLCNKEEREEEKEGTSVKSHRKEKLAIYGLAAVCLLLLVPTGIDYGRTIVTLLSLNEPNRNIVFIAAALLAAVIIAIFIKTASDVLVQVIHKNSPDRKAYLPLLMSGIMLCPVFMLTNYVISSRAERYDEDLKRGSQLIADLREKGAEVKNIYIDDVPVLYKKKIENLSNRILPPKSACEEQDVLIITDKNNEYHMLIRSGYMFGELSDRQGIYTNSESVAEIIKENGIPLQRCYSVKRDVSMPALAEANGLLLTENGGILVEGEGKSLIHGPWITVYGGKLQVEYRLRLKSSSVQDNVLAVARISSESGKNIYKEQELLRSDFNEDGYCSFVVSCGISSSDGMEFLLFSRGDTVLEVEGINYGKVENN